MAPVWRGTYGNECSDQEPSDRGSAIEESGQLYAMDPAALGLDPDRLTYTVVGDLATAAEKARRDAPSIAACDI